MKSMIRILLVVAGIAIIQSQLSEIPVGTQCQKDQRNVQFCNEIYEPVLGVTQENVTMVYGNPCVACSDDAVITIYPLMMCGLQYQKGGICTRIYMPTCGVSENGEISTY